MKTSLLEYGIFTCFSSHSAPICHKSTFFYSFFSQKVKVPEKTCPRLPFWKYGAMDEFSDKIRAFLEDMEMSREVFASLCGVSKRHVDKWLSYLPIPKARQAVIERIMRDEYARRRKSDQNPDMDIIEVHFPRNRYDQARKTADIHGMTVQEWASRSLLALSSVPHHNL